MTTVKLAGTRGIRQRGGTWHYRFKVSGHEYTGNTHLEATTRQLNSAIQKRAETRQIILSGGQIKRLIKPFSSAILDFLDWCRGEYTAHPSTAKRIAGTLSNAVVFFRDEPLGNITSGRLESYKSYRRANLVKEVTLRHDLHTLSLLFQYGMKQGWCSENHLRGKKQGGTVRIPSDKDAVRMHVFTGKEENEYFALAAVTSQDLYDIGRLMILQGCRPEELIGLEQQNVNLASRIFRIVRGKSKSARRELAMYAESVEIFARRLSTHGKWVFPSPRKSGCHVANLAKSHNLIREQTKMSYVMYDFRHTIATRWVQAGIDLPTVASWLGHGSLSSVMKYVHIQPAHRCLAQERYETLMASTRPQPERHWAAN